MTVTAADVAARVRRLAATLGDLRDRVRAAVATEAGRAVADAVRDLLTAALAGPRPDPPPRPAYRGWDPDDDDDAPDDRGRWDDRGDPDAEDHATVAAAPVPPPWPAAVALAAGAVRAWAARRLPGWAAAAVGLAAGGLAVAGGPLLSAGLALAGAAADLLPHVVPAGPAG